MLSIPAVLSWRWFCTASDSEGMWTEIKPQPPAPHPPIEDPGCNALLIFAAAQGRPMIRSDIQTENVLSLYFSLSMTERIFREAAMPDGRLFLHGYCLWNTSEYVIFICVKTYQTFLHVILCNQSYSLSHLCHCTLYLSPAASTYTRQK